MATARSERRRNVFAVTVQPKSGNTTGAGHRTKAFINLDRGQEIFATLADSLNLGFEATKIGATSKPVMSDDNGVRTIDYSWCAPCPALGEHGKKVASFITTA